MQFSDEDFSETPETKGNKNFTDIMHERWMKANSNIPKIDRSDIFDNTYFTSSDQDAFAVR